MAGIYWLIADYCLQGRGLCDKEAFPLKAFLDTFVATKVSGPAAARSGYATGTRLTHPDYAALVDPFYSFAIKRVREIVEV